MLNNYCGGNINLMENSSKDPQKWCSVAHFNDQAGHLKNDEVFNLTYNGKMREDCMYCLEMQPNKGDVTYSAPYSYENGEYVRQEGIGHSERGGEDDDEDRENPKKKRRNSAVGNVVAGFALANFVMALLF